MTEIFVKELTVFEEKLASLLAQGEAGKYAVIFGDELLGTRVAYEEALKLGYQRAGIEKSFLVKKIETVSLPHFIGSISPSRLPADYNNRSLQALASGNTKSANFGTTR